MSLDVSLKEMRPVTVYQNKITHNLNKMAMEAGLYQYLWKPDELGITQASELIIPLQKGLELLSSDPERFKKFNPPNHYGNYELLIKFVQNYLDACVANPEATVDIWR